MFQCIRNQYIIRGDFAFYRVWGNGKEGECMLQNYICLKCNVKTDTSICPVCGGKTVNLTRVFWDKQNNIPLLLPGERNEYPEFTYVSSDIRPVFPEERLLIEILIGEPLKYIDSSCWSTSGGVYIFDGDKIKISIKDLRYRDSDKIREEYEKYSKSNRYDAFYHYVDFFIQANKERILSLTTEALDYVNEKKEKFDFNSMFVSFSGGKDSTVVSDLVMRALGTPKELHIFGDTTLEFPETYEYVQRFKKDHRMTPVLSAKNKEKNFNELCKVIGPPSRTMRWCCTVFKTGAITQYINTMFKNKVKVLTFYGIRHSESTSRSKYDRESDSPKITKQRTVSPIIDWLDADVWLYILSRKIDFNEAYKKGFSRVGCWCCPNNSQWSEFLSKIFHQNDYNEFRNILIENAIQIGKPDPEEYVDSGAWKAKQGGDGIEYSKRRIVSFEPCATEENAFNYELQKPIDQNLYELFKPFGDLNYDLGNKRLNEVYILGKDKKVLLKLQGRIGETHLKVTIVNLPIARAKTIRDAENKIKCQLTKFQMCLNCSACMSICKYDAIKIRFQDGKLDYKVNEHKCVHCYECINHFISGCYLRKVLTSKNYNSDSKVTKEQK